MARFNDTNILITGGSSGIGLATAKRLVSEGAKVLITGTNEERLRVAEGRVVHLGDAAIGVDAHQIGVGDPRPVVVEVGLGGHARAHQQRTVVGQLGLLAGGVLGVEGHAAADTVQLGAVDLTQTKPRLTAAPLEDDLAGHEAVSSGGEL